MTPGELWQRVDRNVEWIEARAKDLAGAETDRTRALDTKASQVLAVAAVATSIAATSLVPRFSAAPASAVWLWACAGVAVLAAAGSAVWALLPRAFLSFESEELTQWPTGDFLSQHPRDVQGRVLNGWLGVIGRARVVNSRKANLVRVALAALGVALLFTTAAAGTIAGDARERTQATDRPSAKRGSAAAKRSTVPEARPRAQHSRSATAEAAAGAAGR